MARVDLKIKLATAAQRACVPQKERTCTTGVSDYVNTNTKCQNACPHGWKRPVLKLSEPRWGPCCRVGGARAAIRGCLHTGDSSRERVSLGHGAQAPRCWSTGAGRGRCAWTCLWTQIERRKLDAGKELQKSGCVLKSKATSKGHHFPKSQRLKESNGPANLNVN